MDLRDLFSRSWRALWVLGLFVLVAAFWGQRTGMAPGAQSIIEVGEDESALAHRRGTLVAGKGPDRLTVFITYSCVFCKQLLETIEAGRQDGQVGTQVYVRHLVPPDADGYSTIAALALECGALQNRATVVHESLLSGDRFETREGLIQALQGVRGLDLGAMETCLADSGLRSSLAIDFEDAVSLAVDGTPTSFYENRSVRGALDLKLVLELIRGES